MSKDTKPHRWKNEGKLNVYLGTVLAPFGKAIKLAGGFFQESGLPDFCFVEWSSRAHFIESKIYPRLLTAKQKLFCEANARRGINCYSLVYFPDTDTYEVYNFVTKENHLIMNGKFTYKEIHQCLS